MKTILVVDDDASIRDAIAFYMKKEGFSVLQAQDGAEALEVFSKEHIDLVILDIMMQKYSGFEVCSAIRDVDVSLPIILLSAKDDLVDKSLGFKLGADDYITKPFEPAELIMRVRSCLRNRQPASQASTTATTSSETCIILDDLSVDVKTRQVSVDGVRVDLTAKEYEILALMARRPNTVFTRQQILDAVWGYDYFGSSGVVAVFIRKIREKIERNPSKPAHIVTEWGVGYRIV